MRSTSGIEITPANTVLIPTLLHWGNRLAIPASQIRGAHVRERGKSRFLVIKRWYASSLILYPNYFVDEDAIYQIQEILQNDQVSSVRLPFPIVTASLVAAMISLFLLSSHYGNPLHIKSILSLGAWYTPGVNLSDAYRAISYAFLHKSWVHLFQNMLALGIVGAAIEHVWSKTRFLSIFVVASVAGALASSIHYEFAIVIGASAGIYGLIGAYVFLRLFRMGTYQDRFLSLSTRLLFLVIGIDFLSGLAIKNLDLVAHVAGLVSGFLYVAFLDFGEVRSRQIGHVSAVVLIVALGFLIQAGYVYINWTPRDTLDVARGWLDVKSRTAVNEGGWLIATMLRPPKGALIEAIRALKSTELQTDSRDTLATLYARSGNFARAVSLEREIIDRHRTPAVVSQLVRFEKKFRGSDPGDAYADRDIKVQSPSTVEGVCNQSEYLRFNVTNEIDLESRCAGRFELLAISKGQQEPIKVKLDPAVLALPL